MLTCLVLHWSDVFIADMFGLQWSDVFSADVFSFVVERCVHC